MKKKSGIILLLILIVTACGSLRVADVANLSGGMNKEQVNNIMGPPVRLLSTDYMQDGVSEVYEYITYRRESYAVEFWNGQLSRYDFMYENATPTYPPSQAVRPPSNPPRPSRPGRPENNRPEERPGHNTGGRSGVSGGGSRSSSNTSSGRTSTGGSSSTRPSYNSRSESTTKTTQTVTPKEEKVPASTEKEENK